MLLTLLRGINQGFWSHLERFSMKCDQFQLTNCLLGCTRRTHHKGNTLIFPFQAPFLLVSGVQSTSMCSFPKTAACNGACSLSFRGQGATPRLVSLIQCNSCYRSYQQFYMQTRQQGQFCFVLTLSSRLYAHNKRIFDRRLTTTIMTIQIFQ